MKKVQTPPMPAVPVQQQQRPSSLVVWGTAARPHTLTASLSPCLVGYASCHPVPWRYKISWMIFCMSVQIGTNLHNDYSDFVRGADTDKRVGQARATAKGWLTPRQTCVAATMTLAVTFLSGIYLASVSHQLHNPMIWFVIWSSIFNAFAYTAGPYPLGYLGMEHWSIAYAGLGDIFVLVYFGYIATLMIPYLLYCQEGGGGAGIMQPPTNIIIDWHQQFRYGTSVGALGMNILVVNNLRDRITDVTANKMTTAVRFGRRFCLIEYVTCLILSYSLTIVDFLLRSSAGGSSSSSSSSSYWRLLPLLSLPMAWREAQSVFAKEGKDLNKHVGGAALVQFAYCVLLAIGLRLTS